MNPPVLEFFCTLDVRLGPIMELGNGQAGKRRIIPIIGGSVSGPHVSGEILNLGADWQTVFVGGTAELDTRYAMRTNDGALIEIRNFGYRHGPEAVMKRVANGELVDPGEYYMRTHARLETGDERYSWVNDMLFVGTGGRKNSSVEISLYAIN
jgi:hypothetical protein